jgi:predicted aconitase
MELNGEEKALIDGQKGAAAATAMRILYEMGRILGAQRFVPIDSAHIDSCLFHGVSGVEFAERLVEEGGRVAVYSSLNVGALDLCHPGKVRLEGEEKEYARRLMNAYVALGCAPTWTCAPYQAGHRPGFGKHVAWAESNAVVFVNSVLGARTNRYGDFMDICCAITGFAPMTGLHLAENRFASVVVDTAQLPGTLKQQDAFYAVLGSWLGRTVGTDIAVIDGLPAAVSEDQLKALGASAASSGGVALFHVAGVTPEAQTLQTALNHQPARETFYLSPAEVSAERDRLGTAGSGQLDVVAVGSPHFSLAEFQQLLKRLGGRKCRVPIMACTGRHVLLQLEAQGLLNELETAGVELVLDTCVVVTPMLPEGGGVLMTNSGKFAHYTPSLTGYSVVFGSLDDCVESAVAGSVKRNDAGWC